MSPRRIMAVVSAVVFAILPVVAVAQPVADKPAITLDPTKAYVLYTGPKSGQPMELIREPNADDIAAYKAAREKALAKAHRKYVSKLQQWQLDIANPVKGFDPGPKPVEPTDANFTFHPIELDTIVAIGPMNRFSKSGERSVYLQEVVPGTYTVYGPISAIPNAAAIGTCLCMGTVQFKADAGVITNLGFMVSTIMDLNAEAKQSGKDLIRDPLALPEGMTTFAIDQKRETGPVDPRIGTYPVRAAVYRVAGKRSNWHGVAIDRLTEMPGIFRYERDKMIDLSAAPR